MTLTGFTSFLIDHPLAIGACVALLLFMIVVSSTWIIRENESGLVIKKYGPALAAGPPDRARRRGGLSGAMLPPGWHFGRSAGSTA